MDSPENLLRRVLPLKNLRTSVLVPPPRNQDLLKLKVLPLKHLLFPSPDSHVSSTQKSPQYIISFPPSRNRALCGYPSPPEELSSQKSSSVLFVSRLLTKKVDDFLLPFLRSHSQYLLGNYSRLRHPGFSLRDSTCASSVYFPLFLSIQSSITPSP